MKRGEPLQRKTALARKTALDRSAGALRRSEGLGRGNGHLARSNPQTGRERPPVEIVCEGCGATFTYTPTGGGRLKACSPRCAADLKRRGLGDRRGQANPNHRNGRSVGRRDRAGERRWYAALGTECTSPTCRDRRGGVRGLALHHVVYAQQVVREGGDKWDPRNAMTLCDSCHSSHHNRGPRVLPLTALPSSAFAFATDTLGAGAAYEYLRRRYVGEDPRLDDLIAQ